MSCYNSGLEEMQEGIYRFGGYDAVGRAGAGDLLVGLDIKTEPSAGEIPMAPFGMLTYGLCWSHRSR